MSAGDRGTSGAHSSPLAARQLSPLRNSTTATDIPALVDEQLAALWHRRVERFRSIVGQHRPTAVRMPRRYRSPLAGDVVLDRAIGSRGSDRVFQRQEVPVVPVGQAARHAAELRRAAATRASTTAPATQYAKGPYAVFDNVTAIFSANPVIRAHGHVHLRLRRVDRRCVPGQRAAAGDLLAAVESDVGVTGELHRRSRSRPVHGRLLRLELQQRHGGDRRRAGAPARPRRHSHHQPQHLRRRASVDSRLVRQARQSGDRRRDVRRLRRPMIFWPAGGKPVRSMPIG